MSKPNVAYAPHIISSPNTQRIMLDVLIALIPALLMAVYEFGFRSLALVCVCAVACVVFEWLFCKITKRESTIWDLSAVWVLKTVLLFGTFCVLFSGTGGAFRSG